MYAHKLMAVLVAGLATATLSFATGPAEAQAPPTARKKPPQTQVAVAARPAARVTVRRRSFLDPGSETKPFAQHYHDYAMSPSYTIFPPFFDYSVAPGSWSRMPLPGLYDVPGWTRGP